jgi:hypothetical protein
VRPTLHGASIVPTSRVSAAAKLVFLMLGNKKCKDVGSDFQWQGVHTKFHESRLNRSRTMRVGRKTHVDMIIL